MQTRSNRRRNTITKYTLLALVGLVAFVLLSCHFCGVRGYKAVGGEVFALLLPVLYYVLGKTVRDIFATEEGGKRLLLQSLRRVRLSLPGVHSNGVSYRD